MQNSGSTLLPSRHTSADTHTSGTLSPAKDLTIRGTFKYSKPDIEVIDATSTSTAASPTCIPHTPVGVCKPHPHQLPPPTSPTTCFADMKRKMESYEMDRGMPLNGASLVVADGHRAEDDLEKPGMLKKDLQTSKTSSENITAANTSSTPTIWHPQFVRPTRFDQELQLKLSSPLHTPLATPLVNLPRLKTSESSSLKASSIPNLPHPLASFHHLQQYTSGQVADLSIDTSPTHFHRNLLAPSAPHPSSVTSTRQITSRSSSLLTPLPLQLRISALRSRIESCLFPGRVSAQDGARLRSISNELRRDVEALHLKRSETAIKRKYKNIAIDGMPSTTCDEDIFDRELLSLFTRASHSVDAILSPEINNDIRVLTPEMTPVIRTPLTSIDNTLLTPIGSKRQLPNSSAFHIFETPPSSLPRHAQFSNNHTPYTAEQEHSGYSDTPPASKRSKMQQYRDQHQYTRYRGVQQENMGVLPPSIGHSPKQTLGQLTTDANAASMCNAYFNERSNRVKRRLSPIAVKAMNTWYQEHIEYPYPSETEKTTLSESTGISVAQVTCWFANKRNRSHNTRKVAIHDPAVDLYRRTLF